MEQADVAALRAAGLGDGEILDACQVAAYYAYVNRMADGLGVELEEYWQLIEKRRRSDP
jgi:alkylhydroperoxidase family enzyme